MLSQPVCGPYYEKNSTLGSAVSSAIASATSAAFAATESKIPTNPAEYPPCAVSISFPSLALSRFFRQLSSPDSLKVCYNKPFRKLVLINTFPRVDAVV